MGIIPTYYIRIDFFSVPSENAEYSKDNAGLYETSLFVLRTNSPFLELIIIRIKFTNKIQTLRDDKLQKEIT